MAGALELERRVGDLIAGAENVLEKSELLKTVATYKSLRLAVVRQLYSAGVDPDSEEFEEAVYDRVFKKVIPQTAHKSAVLNMCREIYDRMKLLERIAKWIKVNSPVPTVSLIRVWGDKYSINNVTRDVPMLFRDMLDYYVIPPDFSDIYQSYRNRDDMLEFGDPV